MLALYAVTIFLSAFLLFQVQPMIAKMILPWFGGSSAVWSTCMLFFQVALLAGYLYAHWLHERLGVRKQALVHGVLLAGSLAALPVIPNPAWRGTGGNPSWHILGLLAVTVGLPYFLLSTTSPLLQAWYARWHAGAVPYRLFALSNLASMLALLTYPVLVEPRLSTEHQAWVWSLAYGCFAALCITTGVLGARRAGAPARAAADPVEAVPPPPSWGLRLLWTALAACASILLLAITTYLTQDVAAIPFLWVVPLSVYLLSFIICFEAPRLYSRPVYLTLLVPALLGLAYMLHAGREELKVIGSVIVADAALFVFCMTCHGELVRMKPHPRHLTVFYVALSAGGAMGGLFVGLMAPNLFNAYYEFPLGLALCAALAAAVLFLNYGAFFRRPRGRVCAALLLAALAGYWVYLGFVVRRTVAGYRVVTRNFYSQLRVRDVDEDDGAGPRRKLLHGTINHGEQFLDPKYSRQSTTYFCPDTGVGRALRLTAAGPPRRVGILGLGCGTLVSYARPGDTFRIYEINPQVLELARMQFSYLKDSPARVDVVMGDGRLSLEREPDQRFDLLVMDAFSGDSIPVHLVTREALRTYLRHLKPGGILAFNVSNKYLDLRPVLERAADYYARQALYFSYTSPDDEIICFDASWVLIVDRAPRSLMPALFESGEVLRAHDGFRMWTDDYSNLFGILK